METWEKFQFPGNSQEMQTCYIINQKHPIIDRKCISLAIFNDFQLEYLGYHLFCQQSLILSNKKNIQNFKSRNFWLDSTKKFPGKSKKFSGKFPGIPGSQPYFKGLKQICYCQKKEMHEEVRKVKLGKRAKCQAD